MKGEATQQVFDRVSPSVVAIVNDDHAIRDEVARRAVRVAGRDTRMPKKVVDVSVRKEPMPHGTGFVVDAGDGTTIVLTAAHVIRSPDTLKLTTKSGQTTPAELFHIDEVRDVALLRPRTPLKDVTPLRLAIDSPSPGQRVWALGHTGAGLWALAWGVSEGITSGTVDMLGAKLLLFDAPVYPGFSGGPVVMLDPRDGKPSVVGVNHAILFAGGIGPYASISSASAAADIRDAMARKPPAIEPKLAAFAKAKASELRAEVFISKNLAVHKDPTTLTTASIEGNEHTIAAGPDGARVPAVAMLFGLPPGDHIVELEIEGPDEKVLQTTSRLITVAPHDRVAFATSDFRIEPKVSGRYHVHAKLKDKQVGHTDVWIEDPDRDDEASDNSSDAEDLLEPQVDVIVASQGREDPFALSGIRAGWVEYRYPRRVELTWWARGTRGWSGTNVAISSFVLDATGKIVGRGVGCVRPELRPEKDWQCAGGGGDPLIATTGRYDIVFTLNERPIAMWPMEALARQTSAIDDWMHRQRESKPLKTRTPR
jgi:S1-C subfamily serine protease